MNEPRTIPPAVQALAQQVGLTPLDWAIHPDQIVIVFVEGPKMTFQGETTEKPTITKHVIKSAPPAAEETPAADDSGVTPPHDFKPKKKGKTPS